MDVYTREPNIYIAPRWILLLRVLLGEFEFTDILKKLKGTKTNKSPGQDNIHPRVLNELQNVIPAQKKIIQDFI